MLNCNAVSKLVVALIILILINFLTLSYCVNLTVLLQMNGSVKELNISIYFFFFRPSLNGVLFPMFCLLVEGECQILVF